MFGVLPICDCVVCWFCAFVGFWVCCSVLWFCRCVTFWLWVVGLGYFCFVLISGECLFDGPCFWFCGLGFWFAQFGCFRFLVGFDDVSFGGRLRLGGLTCGFGCYLGCLWWVGCMFAALVGLYNTVFGGRVGFWLVVYCVLF